LAHDHDYNPFGLVDGRERSRTRVALERWLAAEKWRAAVETCLSAHALGFKQWLVLATTDALTRAPGSGVNQSDIARRTGLDRMTVSRVMRALADAGLADRDTDAMGTAYRIHATGKGRRLLKRVSDAVEAASG
jgi:DNA-binding MarR family transcriptional regulator